MRKSLLVAIALIITLYCSMVTALADLSSSDLQNIVENALAENPPAIRINLRDDTSDTAGVEDLVRAGYLRRIASGPPAYGCHPAQAIFVLTAEGKEEAIREDWVASDDLLYIPVGQYDFVSAHEVDEKLAYSFRLLLSGTGRNLLYLGDAKDWTVSGPDATVTLADAGKPISDIKPLYHSPQGWMLNYPKTLSAIC